MTFAYADPPYVGQAKRHYAADPQCAEVDHAELLERLACEYPDGWALSLSSPSLKQILALCPDDVRVMAWVKPFCSFKPGVNPAYAWEPVIVRGGRRRTREQPTVRDWIAENITLQKGLCGAKPREFCYWLFDVLNVQSGDTLTDLYPGTGIVSRSFTEYTTANPMSCAPLFEAQTQADTGYSGAIGGNIEGGKSDKHTRNTGEFGKMGEQTEVRSNATPVLTGSTLERSIDG